MSKENYDAKLAVLEALPQGEVKPPKTPMDAYLQEAEDQYVWTLEDKEALEAKGLDWKLVTDLPIRAGAARHAQSIWIAERYGQEEASKTWKAESPAAYGFRNDLLADLRFAYRKREDLTARVRQISEGESDADMIQDLSDINALAKANPEELIQINFNMTLLDQAAQRSAELAELLAQANGSKLDNSKTKEMRDRAYTHLKQAMNEIRETGKYVFRKDPERFKGYVAKYRS